MTELYHPAERAQSNQQNTEMPETPEAADSADSQREQTAISSTPEGTTTTDCVGDRSEKVVRTANEHYERGTDWVTFYREVLGVDGAIRRIFSSAEEAKAFESTSEFAEIQQMVARLRERSKQPADCDEPTRVITVRLPQSLHESLREEAHSKRTSMNQLCISKLLQFIDNKLVPSD